MSVWKRILDFVKPPMLGTDAKRREMLRAEAKIGGQLFGPIPKGHQRDFFCLDDRTWIWNECWTDDEGRLLNLQTRYDVYPTGVVKHQNGHPMTITVAEMENLAHAMEEYYRRVAVEVYGVSTDQLQMA